MPGEHLNGLECLKARHFARYEISDFKVTKPHQLCYNNFINMVYGLVISHIHSLTHGEMYWWFINALTRCLDPVLSEMLSHKAVGSSEQGATPDSHENSEGGETSEAHLCLKRELSCDALLLMRTEVRVLQTSAHRAALYWTTCTGKGRGCSWSERSYVYNLFKMLSQMKEMAT